jgi:hypothetical protein
MHLTSSETVERILGYSTVAANALREAAVGTQTPFLNSVATLSLTIIGIVEVRRSEHCFYHMHQSEIQKTKIQRERYVQVVEGIHQSLCALMSLCMYSDEIRSPKLLEEIAHYAG